MTKNGHAKNHVFYEAKRPSGPKWWPNCFKTRCASRALGAFWKPGRAGNGKHVRFGVLCEHLRAFARVSQKLVRGRKGAGARTNSPSREPDEAQKALEAPWRERERERERNTLNIHHFFVRRAKPSNIHNFLVMY